MCFSEISNSNASLKSPDKNSLSVVRFVTYIYGNESITSLSTSKHDKISKLDRVIITSFGCFLWNAFIALKRE